MNRADGDPTLDALRDLLTESFRHWGCNHDAVAVGSALISGENASIEFFRDGAAWIRVCRLPADGPVRWLVESAQPDPLTARTRFPCTSVLHVLRTVRQLADPDFEPGSRIRMGAPGWAA
jgi:hypothetical protein